MNAKDIICHCVDSSREMEVGSDEDSSREMEVGNGEDEKYHRPLF